MQNKLDFPTTVTKKAPCKLEVITNKSFRYSIYLHISHSLPLNRDREERQGDVYGDL